MINMGCSSNLNILIFIAIIVIVILFLKKSRESFVPIGAAAKYQDVLVNCLNQCDMQDPSSRLNPSGSNMNCNAYCEFIVSDMQNKDVPPEDFPLINFSLDTCEKKCGSASTSHEKRECLGLCYSNIQAAQWCKEIQCPYSNFGEGECMKMCTSSKIINNNQTRWNWTPS